MDLLIVIFVVIFFINLMDFSFAFIGFTKYAELMTSKKYIIHATINVIGIVAWIAALIFIKTNFL